MGGEKGIKKNMYYHPYLLLRILNIITKILKIRDLNLKFF